MENLNVSALISFVIGLVTLLAYIYVTQKQIIETLVPPDWLSGLRRIILAVLLVSVFGLVPVVVYQGCRIVGIDSEVLRNVASIAGRISQLATAILLIGIYEYKKGD